MREKYIEFVSHTLHMNHYQGRELLLSAMVCYFKIQSSAISFQ